MKQIELRLALVLYGGVSLAVYMHGVSREVLALLRASDAHRRAREPFEEGVAAARPLSPVETAWLDVFKAFDGAVDLRVVVDAISGASAGGVNGVMLARAIAHDLPLDDHREMWLENADVTRLGDPQNGLSRYLKRTLSPVIDRLLSAALRSQITNTETREKLRGFMESRWFTPPFSGARFSGWMLDACARMDRHWRDGACLLPRGQTLDLFVTLTDYHGQRRRIVLENPAYLEETEHRRILNFRCTHRLERVESDMMREHVADIVFAARATSSFPGAFPPATVAEMDDLLQSRGESWPGRAAFLTRRLGLDPAEASSSVFVDGSVVMNKPFAPVIEVIGARPAMREVVRRLVYVDPMPEADPARGGEEGVPGFFRIILASLAHIPRNEPIGDDLAAIEERNRQARAVSDLIAATDPLVAREVGVILGDSTDADVPTVEDLRRSRHRANEAAHRQAGYARIAYLKLKLAMVSQRISALVAGLAVEGGDESVARDVDARIGAWLRSLEGLERGVAEEGGADESCVPGSIVAFLRGLDVDYRIRRLRFVIRKLNGLYHSTDARAYGQASDLMDDLKTTLYEQIDRLVERWTPACYDRATHAAAAAFVQTDSADTSALSAFLESLATTMALADLDKLHDDVFAVMSVAYLAPPLRRALTGAYIGFPFYDLVTLPVLQRHEYVEINEVLVDRISPLDAGTLHDGPMELRGQALSMFGAFFNRGWREHDYLWGRLNAADRLLGILLSAVDDWRPADVAVEALRQRLFEAIVEEEEAHLTVDPTLIADVKTRLRQRAPLAAE